MDLFNFAKKQHFSNQWVLCISYVTSVRYVAGINHEA